MWSTSSPLCETLTSELMLHLSPLCSPRKHIMCASNLLFVVTSESLSGSFLASFLTLRLIARFFLNLQSQLVKYLNTFFPYSPLRLFCQVLSPLLARFSQHLLSGALWNLSQCWQHFPQPGFSDLWRFLHVEYVLSSSRSFYFLLFFSGESNLLILSAA